jgi:2,3,4,5-tetrahydropyridine-2-carboxylate N-succinyltransferase
VGSCAQIGKTLHLSGGGGIDGVLEPLQATQLLKMVLWFPLYRVEGVHVGKEAVLGANV